MNLALKVFASYSYVPFEKPLVRSLNLPVCPHEAVLVLLAFLPRVAPQDANLGTELILDSKIALWNRIYVFRYLSSLTPHPLPSMCTACSGWSRMTWKARGSCIHSSTAAASLALNRLSRSRDANAETCGSKVGKKRQFMANTLVALRFGVPGSDWMKHRSRLGSEHARSQRSDCTGSEWSTS